MSDDKINAVFAFAVISMSLSVMGLVLIVAAKTFGWFTP